LLLANAVEPTHQTEIFCLTACCIPLDNRAKPITVMLPTFGQEPPKADSWWDHSCRFCDQHGIGGIRIDCTHPTFISSLCRQRHQSRISSIRNLRGSGRRCTASVLMGSISPGTPERGVATLLFANHGLQQLRGAIFLAVSEDPADRRGDGDGPDFSLGFRLMGGFPRASVLCSAMTLRPILRTFLS
jgi:hypothetical protein